MLSKPKKKKRFLKLKKRKVYKKYCLDIPNPPQITLEVKERILKESREWFEEFKKKTKGMQLTAEDWRTIIK